MQQKAAIGIVRSIQPMDKEMKQRVRGNFNSSKGFFGKPLDHEAPILVCDCISFIRNRGFYETGVFRIPGNLDVVNLLKNKYDQRFSNEELKVQNDYSVLNKHKPAPSVNDVASLLKLFFTELPEPLVPRHITKAMLEVSALNLPPEDECQYLGKLVKRIQSPNRECLGLLISFLRELCAFRKFNHMTANNLATCFVLSVFGRGETQAQILLVTTGSQIIKKLIEGQVRIFMPSVKHVKNNTRYKDEVKGEKRVKPAPSTVPVENLISPKPNVNKSPGSRRNLNNAPITTTTTAPAVQTRVAPELPSRPKPGNRPLPTPPQQQFGSRANGLFGGREGEI